MESIEDFSDDRLKAWCIHCGAALGVSATNSDHAPTKSLLERPFPHHVPQVPVCSACNNGFSLDEAYFTAFLSCVLSGSAEPDEQVISAASRVLAKSPKLKARIQAGCSRDLFGNLTWAAESERINAVVLKNARGHAFFELGEPMMDIPLYVCAAPIESLDAEKRSAFEDVSWVIWPEVGSRMMTRLATGSDLINGWVVIQPDVYRYAVLQDGGVLVRSVIRNYLATEVRWD